MNPIIILYAGGFTPINEVMALINPNLVMPCNPSFRGPEHLLLRHSPNGGTRMRSPRYQLMLVSQECQVLRMVAAGLIPDLRSSHVPPAVHGFCRNYNGE